MEKKVVFMIFFTFTVLFFSQIGKGSSGAHSVFRPLEHSIAVMEEHDMALQEWSVYTKRSLKVDNQQGFQAELAKLKKRSPDAKWQVQLDADTWRAIGTSQLDDNVVEQITLVTKHPRKGISSTYLMYEVKGNLWDKSEWNEIAAEASARAYSIFQKHTTFYTCAKGLAGDKMEGVLYNSATELLEDFSAEEVEAMSEETFVSVSAYTNEWETVLPTANGKMNLQIALRNTGLDSPTTVVIGTPIITSEY